MELDPAALDALDPLGSFRDHFTPAPGVLAYLDGNSLGRPPAVVAERMVRFVSEQWGTRLIRGWDDGWWDLPTSLGDRLGELALGAGPGQVVLADSTTVLLYKLARAAVAARPGRTEIVTDTRDFPTDRYLLEGIAAERGLTLRPIATDPAGGVTPEQVADAVGPSTALVALSHVAYWSSWRADAAEITRIAHDAGALVLWDLSHSVGSVPLRLDEWGVDLAAGCTYKYLNGGPGSPAFGYARRDLLASVHQPVQGWTGRRDPFAMAPGYDPEPGVRRLLSGTPPVLGMVPLAAGLDLLAEAGVDAVRAKSELLTTYVTEFADTRLARYGVRVGSPRDVAHRGGHVTLGVPGARDLVDRMLEQGVIPDFREPDGVRIGPAPLSTGFTELHDGLTVLETLLAAR